MSGFLGAIFDEPRLGNVLPVLALALPLIGLEQVLVGVFNSAKILKYRVYTRSLATPLSRLILIVPLLILGYEAAGLAGAYLLSFLIAACVGAYFFWTKFDWIRDTSRESVSVYSLLRYSLPLTFAGIIYTTVWQLDYFVIGYFLPTAKVGIYRVATQLTSNLVVVSAALTPVYKPMIAEVKRDSPLVGQRYKLATRWITMFTLPLIIVLAIAPKTYLSLLFTPEYAVAGTTVLVLCLGYLSNALGGPEGAMLEGLGHTRLSFINSIILIIVNFTLDVLLVPRYGILGAAIGTSIALTVRITFGVGEIWYLYRVHPFGRPLVRVFAASVPVVVLGYTLLTLIESQLVLAVVLPAVVGIGYVSILPVVGAFTEADEQFARRIDDRLGHEFVTRLVVSG
jgi:O-antigen/teichoic acid export membrane protein